MRKLIVKKSIAINAPARKVWDIIVSPKMWEKWMLVAPELEGGNTLKIGSKIAWKNESGKAYLIGTVISFEPEKKLVFELADISWPRKAKPGEVTYSFELTEQNGATELHYSFGDASVDPEGGQWFDAYNEGDEPGAIKALAEK
jgi:uncharacterized protein YndB with AHSA1/START domain